MSIMETARREGRSYEGAGVPARDSPRSGFAIWDSQRNQDNVFSRRAAFIVGIKCGNAQPFCHKTTGRLQVHTSPKDPTAYGRTKDPYFAKYALATCPWFYGKMVARSHIKSKDARIMTKAVALRINLNLAAPLIPSAPRLVPRWT